MTDGTIFIMKRGTGWELSLTSSHSSSSLKCERGWKTRKGETGRSSLVGLGSIDNATEAVLDKFLVIPGITYVNIEGQSFIAFVFDQPLRRLSAEDREMEAKIVAVIRELLEWDIAQVQTDGPEPQGYLIPSHMRTR